MIPSQLSCGVRPQCLQIDDGIDTSTHAGWYSMSVGAVGVLASRELPAEMASTLVEGDRLMRPSWQFMMSGTAIGIFAVAVGALLCLAPHRFVSIYRSVTTDKAAQTAEWQTAMDSRSGRLLGAAVFAFGGWLLWVLHFYRR